MRLIDQKIWNSLRFRRNIVDIKERYFWLYLLTCANSKSCGIFYLPIDTMVIESKLTENEIKEYLKKFQELNLIVYCYDYEEILIYNFPRYNIVRLGKPMEDCIRSELSLVKNTSLIAKMITFLQKYIDTRTNDKKIDTLKRILNIYINNNTNININNESCNDTISEEEWQQLLKELGE